MKTYEIEDIKGRLSYLKIQNNTGMAYAQTHIHNFVELIYVYDGNGVQTIGGIEYVVSAGDMLFVNYGQTHSFECNGNMSFYEILMKPEFLSEKLAKSHNVFELLMLTAFSDFDRGIENMGTKVSFDSENGEVRHLFEEIERENRDGKGGFEAVIRSDITVILIKLFRRLSSHESGAELRINSEFLEYINEHCDSRLTLSAIAERFLYNPSYFSRMFKHYSGMTLTEYIHRARIERACKMLTDTDFTIDYVSEHCGFSDKTMFYKKFRQYKGALPSEYRKR